MSLNDLRNSEEIKEIFDHIQDILNEKNESEPQENRIEKSKTSQEKEIGTKQIISKKSKPSFNKSSKTTENKTLKKSNLIKTKKSNKNKLKLHLKNQGVDLASLSKELDIINKRINQASVMTVEHEQFKENNMINDADKTILNLGIEDLNNRTCDLCNNDIELEKNLSGLVVGGEFFACESCCKNSSNEDLMDWTKSKMKTSSDFQPIGLWVTREKNKKK